MSIHINLTGEEAQSHVAAVVRAIHAYAGIETLSAAVESKPATTITTATTPAATPAADAAPAETAAAKKKREAAEKKAADDAAAAAAKAAEPAVEDGPDRTVEEIRGLAGQFATAETRPLAIAVLREYGVKSVSEFEGKTAAERVAAFDALQVKLDEIALG